MSKRFAHWDNFRPETLAELIRYVYKNPEAAREMGCQGRRDAKERFDLSYTIKQYMEVFDDVISER